MLSDFDGMDIAGETSLRFIRAIKAAHIAEGCVICKENDSHKEHSVEHRTNFYVQLGYDEYKEVENQLRDFASIETSHSTVEGYYHKALRIKIGTSLFEIQGPLVKAPLTNE